ncbi:STAS/SEC14 domain-containing protein [Polyangium aurulentum]|uniref:STAS/SEC14 domain-containing protein n=1 Tax=Polyangium aurulentum TaxID=2567896 RepID=UPI0010ADD9CC|nr:STAS/SEC14 domain-containing protein [Polyangium aurulentum]UQA58664.1 STAS/SEC14 domain-containing protein [Polyangium aurulentum]
MDEDGDQESWCNTGGHAYRCEGEGILFLRIAGDLEEGNVATFFQAFAGLCDWSKREHVFWLVDLARLGNILPGARKLAATTQVRRENKGMVIFGASFRQRAIATLIDKATALLQRDAPPMVFVDSEAEARAWIEGRRRKLAGELPLCSLPP